MHDSASIVIESDGPLIVASNYWDTQLARDGVLYLSTNARAFRLLLPPQWEAELAELATAKLVIVSRPRTPGRYALELLFDDHSDNPYAVHLSAPQVDRLPVPEDDGRRDLDFAAWTRPRRGVPHQALRRPAAYRVVPRLPWAKSWE